VSALKSLRKVIGPSRVMTLAALAAVVFFTAGFVELAMTRRTMEGHYQQALERKQRLERQNVLLQIQLERGQRGELVPWQAWDMFGRLPKGTNGVQTEPAVVVEDTSAEQPEGPVWRSWLKALGIN
jgi:hypothetical protein